MCVNIQADQLTRIDIMADLFNSTLLGPSDEYDMEYGTVYVAMFNICRQGPTRYAGMERHLQPWEAGAGVSHYHTSNRSILD